MYRINFTKCYMYITLLDIGVQLHHFHLAFEETTADSITRGQKWKVNCSVKITWQSE